MRPQKFSSPAREKRLLRSLKIAGKRSFAKERKSATLFESTARSSSTPFVLRSLNLLLNTPVARVHRTPSPACNVSFGCLLQLANDESFLPFRSLFS